MSYVTSTSFNSKEPLFRRPECSIRISCKNGHQIDYFANVDRKQCEKTLLRIVHDAEFRSKRE